MHGYKRVNRLVVSGLIFGLAIALSSAAPAVRAAGPAGAKPYFKVYGGDVFTGGAFSTGASSTGCTNNYQYSAPGSTDNKGGIFTYAKLNGNNGDGGASSQYAAYALGPIEGDSASDYGFYTDQAKAPTAKDSLSFANTSATSWGGYFDGNVSQSDCIPDYYDLKLDASSATPLAALTTGTPSGQYTASGSPFNLTNGNVQIQPGEQITVFVNGSVYINKNISYSASYSDTQVPKFTLVAKGNIYIDPSVTNLDGLYIAQPSSTADTDGVLWTCHDGSTDDKPLSTWFSQNCGNKLTINGAVVAQQVNFMRVNGDIANAAATANEPAGSNNIAEVINYVPAMVIGGSFFNQSPPTNQVESLISLPPVF